MYRTVFGLAMVLAAFQSFAQQPPTDWKYFGSFKTTRGEDIVLFYLNNDIRHLPAQHVEVWMKGLRTNELDKEANTKTPNQAVVERTAKKVAAYYMPPIGRVWDLDADKALSITFMEEMANEGSIQIRVRNLLEIDCREKQYRELSTYFAEGGRTESSDRPSEWHHVAPESPSATLHTLLCTSDAHE